MSSRRGIRSGRVHSAKLVALLALGGCYGQIRPQATVDTHGRVGFETSGTFAVQDAPFAVSAGAGYHDGISYHLLLGLQAPLVPELLGGPENRWGAYFGAKAGLRTRQGAKSLQLSLEGGPLHQVQRSESSAVFLGSGLQGGVVFESGDVYGLFGLGPSVDILLGDME